MAMTTCPECGKELSDKAYTCPHCGYPLKTPPQEKTVYSLQKGTPTSSGFATFLYICAVICWIGGLIVAIAGGKAVEEYGYRYREVFSFSAFITLLIPYAIYGVLLWCMGTLVSEIKATYEIVSDLHLTSSTSNGKTGSVSNSKGTYISHPKRSSEDWKCSECGTYNPSHAQFCKGCGKYK